MVNKVV